MRCQSVEPHWLLDGNCAYIFGGSTLCPVRGYVAVLAIPACLLVQAILQAYTTLHFRLMLLRGQLCVCIFCMTAMQRRSPAPPLPLQTPKPRPAWPRRWLTAAVLTG